MDVNKEDSCAESSGRSRKFGLPNWMVNNIERLNFVTDFEQYACSPPETEGFLTDYVDSHSLSDSSGSYCSTEEHNDLFEAQTKNVSQDTDLDIQKQPTSSSVANSVDCASSAATYHSLLSSRKQEDFFSSPDSTPCATPEPSPAPRRRMSGQQETVQTNPGRWFYLGNLKKPDQKLKGLSVSRNRESKVAKTQAASNLSHEAKKDGIKLVISNFDINAISPTSW